MNRMNGPVGRPDLPRTAARASEHAPVTDPPREPSLRNVPDLRDPSLPRPEHLGAYAPLIAAIRDELEHFVSSQLRLHLAIAERDRYLLCAIDVECDEGSDDAALLRRFVREFTPEQIKRFLARDVIGHLPNAGSIDLSQFAGLGPARAQGNAAADDGYAELRAQLRATAPDEETHAFEVTLVGRWTETDGSGTVAGGLASPRTPLAGSRVEIEIEDANGTRHVTLPSVIPNRRYAIGKGEGCDIVVDGTFASRRHCEIWLDKGAWWTSDAGSTNGIRVEAGSRVVGRTGGPGEASAQQAIEMVPGARIVLSALSKGKPSDYPQVALKPADTRAPAATPVSRTTQAPSTPVTPIAAPRPQVQELELTVTMATGVRSVVVQRAALPISVGRSRAQDVVVDWVHEGVSGHHVDITAFDSAGAEVEVHGDNGVTIAGAVHPPGQRFRWRLGEPMTLGRASSDEPECRLLLSAKP
jgi:pSer/pThr/pTyr-binding forkhead associated (FHA) protein